MKTKLFVLLLALCATSVAAQTEVKPAAKPETQSQTVTQTNVIQTTVTKAAVSEPEAKKFALAPREVSDQWVLSLGGTGFSKTAGGGDTAFGIDLSIGRTAQWHIADYPIPAEFGLRQGLSFSSVGRDTTLLSTRGYLDITLLSYDKFDFFAGGNVGLTYGNTSGLWEVAPEGGVRYWLKHDVAILTRIEYPFNLNKGRGEDTLRYFLGLQVKF